MRLVAPVHIGYVLPVGPELEVQHLVCVGMQAARKVGLDVHVVDR